MRTFPDFPDARQRLPSPYRSEADVVTALLGFLAGGQEAQGEQATKRAPGFSAIDWEAAAQVARPWVQAVRDHPPPFWAMESLLRDYPISSAEGLALMRLAEALLRVPDLDTAMALMADQLLHADFDATGDSVMARLSASVIALAKRFLTLPTDPASGLMGRLGARTVVAAALRAVQLLGRQFVLGQTMAQAMNEADVARQEMAAGHAPGKAPAKAATPPGARLRFSYDMLGEGARTGADALRYLASYTNAIELIAVCSRSEWAVEENDGISIKLSALHPRYEEAQRERVMAELVPRVWGLCVLAARANISLTIDAEEVDRLELSLDVFEALAASVAQQYPAWQGLGLALQAYQSRSLDLVQHVIALARRYRLRLMCRLVKGAYWDAEIKRAQTLGLPHYPVFTHKQHTDVAYLACAKALLAAPDAIYPQFAGHNAGTIAAILQMVSSVASVGASGRRAGPPQARPAPSGGILRQAQDERSTAATSVGAPFELQRLHGMGEGLFREVLKNPLTPLHTACRVYAPVGAYRDLLAYLVRRLLENGANASFVHQLADASVGLDELLTSPLQLAPESSLPLPPALYGPQRQNSAGLDLSVASMRAPLQAAFDAVVLPQVPEFDVKLIASPMKTGALSYQKWSNVAVAERAAILRQAADALEQHLPKFCALLVKEAFKTWGDAVSEVREAVDFLRYYADEAERIMAPRALPSPTGETNELRLVARGVWVCISPWNFPLAIFIGQVAAALSTGNAVIAKPAEQTPGVAWEAVKLLHAAGVPEGALQLLHGPGETVGAALVAASGVAGVVFTGSTPVAKAIQRALAAKDGPRGPDGPPAPIVPLIAETGGINAMLVDSSALPEQVVDAVLQSAFRSSGQRCSALRLLCVHEGIADDLIAMLRGAMKELVLGDAADLATDIGPVIDRDAFEHLQRHLTRLGSSSKSLLAQHIPRVDATDSVANDLTVNRVPFLVAPAAFEVASVAEVQEEIFGPVLQIVRWSGDPAEVIAQINALGYGLTLGLQTRIDSRAQALAQAAQVGNVYVNRNMIGAVVGVQPFGGAGLSGTGPKAGGPHYLYRFCNEQAVTVNTAAAGGDPALLAAAQ